MRTPSDLTAALVRARERRRAATTTSLSLISLTLIASAAAVFVHVVQPSMAITCAVIAAAGGAGAFVAARLFALRHDDLCDDILVAELHRHAREPAVLARAAKLVSARQRAQLAATLERFISAAHHHEPLAVPLSRAAVRDHTPQLRALTEVLRTDRHPVTPAGMVLVRRLITDGSASPLYHAPAGRSRDLERTLAAIHSRLSATPPEHSGAWHRSAHRVGR